MTKPRAEHAVDPEMIRRQAMLQHFYVIFRDRIIGDRRSDEGAYQRAIRAHFAALYELVGPTLLRGFVEFLALSDEDAAYVSAGGVWWLEELRAVAYQPGRVPRNPFPEG